MSADYSFDLEDFGVCKVGNNQTRRGLIARSCEFETLISHWLSCFAEG